MTEIDRVNAVIDAFFDASGEEDVTGLVDAIDRTLMTARMRSYELEAHSGRYYVDKMENENFIKSVDALEEELQDLKVNLPKDRDTMKARFKDITFKAMAAKRATFPLTNPDCPWETITPEQALADDDDMYSFAIFDTQAEAIQELSPVLYQLACEADCYDGDGEQDDDQED